MRAKHFVLNVSYLCVCFLFAAASVQSQEERNGTTSPSLFEVAEIVPEVLDKPPESALEVKYGFVPVKLGQELTPTELMNEPEANWEADPDTFYILLMSYPDAPFRMRPRFREGRPWLVVNIPGKNVSAGEAISVYSRPVPMEGSGLHRFVILLYRQPGKLVFDEPVASTPEDFTGRLKVSTRAFAKKYGLGDPIAGNFFETEWDESVPRLYEQMALIRATGIDFSKYYQ